MEKIDIDTDKIKTQGEELKTIANELSTLMDEMYTQLTRIGDNGIWKSETMDGSAARFIANVTKDKKNNMNLCKNLNNVGNAMIEYSNRISSSADTSVRG